jgi:hypothetical protein
MFIASPLRRVGLAAVIACASTMQLSACGSDSPAATAETSARTTDTGAARGLEQAQGSVVAPIADAAAIWGVVQKLSARDVEILYASFTSDVQDDLAEIVHAAAEAARG